MLLTALLAACSDSATRPKPLVKPSAEATATSAATWSEQVLPTDSGSLSTTILTNSASCVAGVASAKDGETTAIESWSSSGVDAKPSYVEAPRSDMSHAVAAAFFDAGAAKLYGGVSGVPVTWHLDATCRWSTSAPLPGLTKDDEISGAAELNDVSVLVGDHAGSPASWIWKGNEYSTLASDSFQGGHIDGLASSGGQLAAFGTVGDRSVTWTMANGSGWATPRPQDADVQLAGIAANSDGFMAVGQQNDHAIVLASNDGSDWKPIDIGRRPPLRRVSADDTTFTLSSDDGTFIAEASLSGVTLVLPSLPEVALRAATCIATSSGTYALAIDRDAHPRMYRLT